MTKYRSISEPFSPAIVEKRQFDFGDSVSKNNNCTEDEKTEITEDDIEDYHEFRRWCGIRRSTVLLIFYVVSYFSYLLLGGYIMSVLETPNEMDIKNKTRKRKEEFLRNNPNVNRKYVLSILHSQIQNVEPLYITRRSILQYLLITSRPIFPGPIPWKKLNYIGN